MTFGRDIFFYEFRMNPLICKHAKVAAPALDGVRDGSKKQNHGSDKWMQTNEFFGYFEILKCLFFFQSVFGLPFLLLNPLFLCFILFLVLCDCSVDILGLYYCRQCLILRIFLKYFQAFLLYSSSSTRSLL